MSSFASQATPTAQKLRGGYYTPAALAGPLADWVARDARRLLEPSCGDGAILAELVQRGQAERVVGIELDEIEAALCAERSQSATIVNSDFFEWFGPPEFEQWDAVAGNPPFIRYQNWSSDTRDRAFDLMRSVGLRPTRLTNAWVPFVVGATLAIRKGGRLGLVLPAELMQVGYAAELRAFLVDTFEELTAVTFQTLLFEGVLQEVVLLLGVRGDGPATVRVVEVPDAASLRDLDSVTSTPHAPALAHDREKWTRYLLPSDRIDALRKAERSDAVTKLGDLAEVDVGVVTGRNAFFVLRPSEADALGLADQCIPLVSKSAHVPGLTFTHGRLEDLREKDARCLLLSVSEDVSLTEYPALARYVAAGEDAGVHHGYKCAIRRKWWTVPSIWTPDAFLLRQIYDHPRIIANRAGATSTDTVHRVRARPGVDPRRLAVASINSLTFAFSEVLGRSYGGGVLELEPREAEELPFPRLDRVTSDLAREVERLVSRADLYGALDLVDRTLLPDLPRGTVESLRRTWELLRDRRLARGRKVKSATETVASLAA